MTDTPADATIGRVVVGVDGSAGATAALRWAWEEAALRGATLEVVHAWSPAYAFGPPGLGAIPADVGDGEEDAAAVLDEVVGQAIAEHEREPAEVRRVLVRGAPARALLDRAAGADLLVVGSRGHSAVAELLLGSVSHQCVHHAPCPVVVVHPDPRR